LPGFGSAGGELGGQRSAEERTAAVPLAVGADEDQGLTGVRVPDAAVVPGPQRGEVQPEDVPRVGDGGGADPGAARGGVRDEQPAPGEVVAVGVPSGAPDESDA